MTAPTSRPDVRPAPFGLADVAEEVARLHGYAALPTRVPSWPAPGALAPVVVGAPRVREALVGLGALEAWTATMVGEGDAVLVGDEDERVRVTNPVAQDEPVLRSSLLPGLLGALRRNVERRQGDVALFEVGTTFTHVAVAETPRVERGGEHGGELVKLPSEDERVALLLGRPGDDARSAVASWRALAGALRLEDVRIDVDRLADACRTACTRRGSPRSSTRRAVRSSACSARSIPSSPRARVPGLDADRRLGWLDVSLGVLADPELARRRSEVAVVPSRFPTSDVDLALLIDEAIGVHEVKAVLRDAAGELCESVACFDAYRGPGVPEGIEQPRDARAARGAGPHAQRGRAERDARRHDRRGDAAPRRDAALTGCGAARREHRARDDEREPERRSPWSATRRARPRPGGPRRRC